MREESKKPVCSFVLPCLNEEKTIALCIEEIRQTALKAGMPFEIILADNGSADKSVAIAHNLGARIVNIKEKGYGVTLHEAVLAAEGSVILFADSDMSYPFNQSFRLIEPIMGNAADFILANRLKGNMEPKAMPFLNRYAATPFLSFLIRLFYGLKVYDCNSGMRAFKKATYLSLGLKRRGMDYASEMLISVAKKHIKYMEVIIDFRCDLRGRPPHLRRWKDGVRHLCVIIKSLFSS